MFQVKAKLSVPMDEAPLLIRRATEHIYPQQRIADEMVSVLKYNYKNFIKNCGTVPVINDHTIELAREKIWRHFAEGSLVQSPLMYNKILLEKAGDKVQEVFLKTLFHVGENKKIIAFFNNDEALVRERSVETQLNKFLTKFFGEYITDREREQIVSDITCGQYMKDFKISNDPEVFSYVYTNGPRSCMQTSNEHYLKAFDARKRHACQFYGGGDLSIAYLERDDGSIYSRCIVNTRNKTYQRIYGSTGLQSVLEAQGYMEAGRKGKTLTEGLKLPYKFTGQTKTHNFDRGQYKALRNLNARKIAELMPYLNEGAYLEHRAREIFIDCFTFNSTEEGARWFELQSGCARLTKKDIMSLNFIYEKAHGHLFHDWVKKKVKTPVESTTYYEMYVPYTDFETRCVWLGEDHMEFLEDSRRDNEPDAAVRIMHLRNCQPNWIDGSLLSPEALERALPQ